jgi:hypothetical protein
MGACSRNTRLIQYYKSYKMVSSVTGGRRKTPKLYQCRKSMGKIQDLFMVNIAN